MLWYIVFLYSITAHEAAHAWAAFKLGDSTAFLGGQVSLNPWPHIRRAPIGMVVVPILSWLTGGWIMGWADTPFNLEWARRYPRRAGLMAAAGPAANLALMLLAALVLRIGLEWHWVSMPIYSRPSQLVLAANDGGIAFVAHALSITFSLNLLLLAFNLLPIPPLDGSSLPLIVLPDTAAAKFFDLVRSPTARMVGLIIILRSSGFWFQPLFHCATAVLYFRFSPNS
jgi:Zn-dependent protease